MKIAILISGEYRTFPICRKTMGFLDDPRVDVYVSTWDKSIVKNERLGLDINDTITESKVRSDLGRDAIVMVEQVEGFVEQRYNSKMIHRWKQGFELIRSSGKIYNYVMVMRPDLFFNVDNNFNLDTILGIKDEFRIAWHDGHEGLAQDNMFAASYEKMNELFSKLSVDAWVSQNEECDWHKWWNTFIRQTFSSIQNLASWESVSFCRSLVKPGSSYVEVREAEFICRDSLIIDQIKTHGRDFVVRGWSEAVVQFAEKRFASGFYDRYKKQFKVAVLVSGEYRTFKTSRKTMGFLDDPDIDVYFSTWSVSQIKNKRLNLDVKEEITYEKIQADLSPTILTDAVIEDSDEINLPNPKGYGSKMLHRWIQGIDLIKKSGRRYDWVMIVRPDIFLNPEDKFPGFKALNTDLSPEVLHVAWSTEIDKGSLGDFLFLSSAENMYSLITDELISSWWGEVDEGNIHTWWYRAAKRKMKTIQQTPRCLNSFTLNRFEADRDYTVLPNFQEIDRRANVWTEGQQLDVLRFFDDRKISEDWTIDPMANSNNGKTALIISGMLRNYDAALLSLPIWGEADRFLITWESAGQDVINDYIRKAEIMESFSIPDVEIERVYCAPFNMNSMRMLYLWQSIFKHVPKNYDRYIIIRPDGFYWADDFYAVLQCINGCAGIKVNGGNRELEVLSDHVVVFEQSGIEIIQAIFDNMIPILRRRVTRGESICIHYMLFELFETVLKVDAIENTIGHLIHSHFVRDTFKPLNTDKYDWDLYTSIFYDTAAWWRREKSINYGGMPKPQKGT